MSWTKIDDGAPHHPKARRAGLEAWGLYVASITYAARHLSDGRIPSDALEDVWPWPGSKLAALAQRLVDAGLWEKAEDGWQVHDYLQYQPSAADVKAKREADAARKRTGGRPASAPTPRGVHPASETTRGRDPVPSRPVPSRPRGERESPAPQISDPSGPNSLAPTLAGLYAEERSRLHPALPPYELFQRDRSSWDAVARTVAAHAARHELDVRDVARSVVQRFLEVPDLAKHAWPPKFLADRVETLLGALATVSAAAATAAVDPLLTELRELDARMAYLRVTPGTELERDEVQKRIDEVCDERRRRRAHPEAAQ